MTRYFLSGISVVATFFMFLMAVDIDRQVGLPNEFVTLQRTNLQPKKLTVIKTNQQALVEKKKIIPEKKIVERLYDFRNDFSKLKSNSKKEFYNQGYSGQKVAVLCYHRIDSGKRDSYYVTLEKFRWQMQYLKKYCNVITSDTLVGYIYYKQGLSSKKVILPPRAVVIQFDDNYRSVYTKAFPVLKRLGLPWTFFVYKHHHRPNKREHLVRMARSGVDIQSHSMTHPWFHKPARGQSLSRYIHEMHWQVGGSKKYLEKISRRPVIYLAYPFGTYSDLAIKLCATYKYRAMFAADGGYATENSPLSAIERILVTKGWSKSYFKKIVSGKMRYRKVFQYGKLIRRRSVVRKLTLPKRRYL